MFRFRLGAVIDVPTDVFPSGKARLFGVEEGHRNNKLAKYGYGYVYTLIAAAADGGELDWQAKLVAGDDPRYAAEELIAQWKQANPIPLEESNANARSRH